MSNSNLLKSIGHAIVAALLFAIPLALSVHAGWQDATVGTILNAIYLHFYALKA